MAFSSTFVIPEKLKKKGQIIANPKCAKLIFCWFSMKSLRLG